MCLTCRSLLQFADFSFEGRKSDPSGHNDSAVEGVILFIWRAEEKMLYATLKFTLHIPDGDDENDMKKLPLYLLHLILLSTTDQGLQILVFMIS